MSDLNPQLVEPIRDLVGYLQKQPLCYRHFGIYWWRLKLLIKKYGYTRAVLIHLGESTDEEFLYRFEDLDDGEFLAAALEEQLGNGQLHYLSPWVPVPGDEPRSVFLFDPDAEP